MEHNTNMLACKERLSPKAPKALKQSGGRARITTIQGATQLFQLKSVERLAPVHAKQLLAYLRLMDQPLGLLMNFGAAMFRNGLKRVINSRSDHIAPSKA